MGARFVYDVYDGKSSLPIIIGGTARECAAALGISECQFRHYIKSHQKKRLVVKDVVEQEHNKFGTRCRNARMAAGLTQAQVAHEVGISIPTYKKYEQGVSLPNVEITVRIAKVLKVSIRYLTGGYYE